MFGQFPGDRESRPEKAATLSALPHGAFKQGPRRGREMNHTEFEQFENFLEYQEWDADLYNDAPMDDDFERVWKDMHNCVSDQMLKLKIHYEAGRYDGTKYNEKVRNFLSLIDGEYDLETFTSLLIPYQSNVFFSDEIHINNFKIIAKTNYKAPRVIEDVFSQLFTLYKIFGKERPNLPNYLKLRIIRSASVLFVQCIDVAYVFLDRGQNKTRIDGANIKWKIRVSERRKKIREYFQAQKLNKPGWFLSKVNKSKIKNNIKRYLEENGVESVSIKTIGRDLDEYGMIDEFYSIRIELQKEFKKSAS